MVETVPSDAPPTSELPAGDADRHSNDRWVTFQTFWTAPEAHVARLQLESEGIECYLFDENIVSTDWGMANAAGGIKLKVRESDLPAAEAALRDTSGRAELSRQPAVVPAGQHFCQCPRCGSMDTYRDSVWRRPMFALLLAVVFSFGFVLVFALPWILMGVRPWRCLECGNTWDPGTRGFELHPQT